MTTKIEKRTRKNITKGEFYFIKRMITETFPSGMVSLVCDSFDLWSVITQILPALKEEIMARDGKLVIRPDSGDPVDIICGYDGKTSYEGFSNIALRMFKQEKPTEYKGAIELLWDIFGGTINAQGYKVLDPHIGAIYGDSINLERQVQIYERLAAKGFAATNIVLGVGSFTYQLNTRDSLGFAAKGAWFEVEELIETPTHENTRYEKVEYSIYKDPVTDDGGKKSLKGLQQVWNNNPNCSGGEILFDGNDDFKVKSECSWDEERGGLLQLIYNNGNFYNQTTLTKIRKNLNFQKE